MTIATAVTNKYKSNKADYSTANLLNEMYHNVINFLLIFLSYLNGMIISFDLIQYNAHTKLVLATPLNIPLFGTAGWLGRATVFLLRGSS